MGQGHRLKMGRNKGRQCGGYASKLERFALQRTWQREVARVVNQRRKERQAQGRLDQKRREMEARDASTAVKRRVRIDVVKALMNARLNEDKIEQIKMKRVESITTELQRSMVVQGCPSLQERCLQEIAKTFDLYSASCPFTQQFFASFEPWMITRLSELTAAFKTMNDDNVSLLLLQRTDELTVGFVRQQASLTLLVQEDDGKQQLAWHRSGPFSFTSNYEVAENWDDLDVEEVDVVQTRDEVEALQTLRLISCRGLATDFLANLAAVHPSIEHLEIIDCFDAADSEAASMIMRHLSRWRSLKTLRFSWCSWLTTESLVAFAYQLQEPPASGLVSLEVTNFFDVVEDYVAVIYAEMLPHLNLKLR